MDDDESRMAALRMPVSANPVGLLPDTRAEHGVEE
jgi:hypothetical protein